MTTIERKKGDTIHMYAFTGMYLGEFEITTSDKKSISVLLKSGKTVKFDRETGKQIDAKTPRCASYVLEEKAPEKKPAPKKATKKAAEPKPEKKATKKAKPAPVVEEEDDDEDYEEA